MDALRKAHVFAVGIKNECYGKFLNPFTDVGFKRIFGQEINKDLLSDFLNSLLEGEKRVGDVRFWDKELLPDAVRREGCWIFGK